ncbi:hypothetical protein BSLG_000550 [Batrachochytrium salamandrivorans]|nr:hypothetical protein BSLG_000550 [Batrachochytrium salamandrivorans]
MPTFEALAIDDSPTGRTTRISNYTGSAARSSAAPSRGASMHPVVTYLYGLLAALARLVTSLWSTSSVKDMANGTGDHSSTGLYALKRIAVQLPEHEERLRGEIAAHGCVTHSPYVVNLVDSQCVMGADGSIVEGRLLLPYFKNGTVQDLINKTPSGEYIPLATILKIGIDICKGLQAFHSRSPPLAFRDLKPANVLIGDDGKAVLMDLGSVALARVQVKSRRDAVALQELCAETVTAPFRAPELFDPPSDALISEAVDIWALGCTLYAMAYGESPFDGTMTAVISCKLSFPPNDPYGPQFRTVMEGIIQSQPTARPSANQIEQLLVRFLGSLTTQA